MQQTPNQKDNQHPLNVPIPETIVNNKNNDLSILYYDREGKTIRCKANVPINSRRDKESFVMNMVEKCVLYPGASDASIDNIANEIVAVRKTPTWGNNSICNYTELLTPTLLQARLLEVTSQKEMGGAVVGGKSGAASGPGRKKSRRKSSVTGNTGATKQPAVVQRFIHTKGRQAGLYRVFWVSGGKRDGNATTVGYKISKHVSYGYSTVKVKTSMFDGSDSPVKKQAPVSGVIDPPDGGGDSRGAHYHHNNALFSNDAHSQHPSRSFSIDNHTDGHHSHGHGSGSAHHSRSGSPAHGHHNHSHNHGHGSGSAHHSRSGSPAHGRLHHQQDHADPTPHAAGSHEKTPAKTNSIPHYAMALHSETEATEAPLPLAAEVEVVEPPVVEAPAEPALKSAFLNLFLDAMKGKHTLNDIKPLSEATMALSKHGAELTAPASAEAETCESGPMPVVVETQSSNKLLQTPSKTDPYDRGCDATNGKTQKHHRHSRDGGGHDTSSHGGARRSSTSGYTSDGARRRSVVASPHNHDNHGWGHKNRRRSQSGGGGSGSESSSDETDSDSHSDDGHLAPRNVRFSHEHRPEHHELNKYNFSQSTSYQQYANNMKDHNYNTVREPRRREDSSGSGLHYSAEDQKRRHQQQEYRDEQTRMKETGSPMKAGHRPGANTYGASMLEKVDTRYEFLDNMDPIVVEAVYQNNITKTHELTKNLGSTALCCVTNNSTSFPVIEDSIAGGGRGRTESTVLSQSPFELAMARSGKGADAAVVTVSPTKLEAVKETKNQAASLSATATAPTNDIFNMKGQRLVITKVSASAVEYAIERIEELVHWLQATIFRLENIHVKFSSMVVDFMKETGTGQWYMIQVKGFELVPSESFNHRLLLWNYNRMLRVAAEEGEEVDEELLEGRKEKEIDSDYHVFSANNATSELVDSAGRPVSASKLMKNITHARNMNRTLDNSLKSTQETIRRMMSERGNRCHLCGLYFVHDAFISIALGLESESESEEKVGNTGRHKHKAGHHHHHQKHTEKLGEDGSESDGSQGSIEFLMGNYDQPMKSTATHSPLGRSSSPAKKRGGQNRTTGENAASGMRMKHVPAYGYFITMNMAYKLLEIYYDIAHHEGKGYKNASRLAHKTKFAREIFCNYSENKSNPSASWAQHMYEAVTCCYYCHQVIEEYNQYVQVLQQFNRALGTDLGVESAVHGAEHGDEMLNRGGTVMISATAAGKKIKPVAVLGSIENEIAAAMGVREEFLRFWWKYHRAQPNNRPSGYDSSVECQDNEVDHIKADDIFSVQALMHQNNSFGSSAAGLTALGLSNNRVNHQWRLLIMSHFIADTVNNSILNEIIYNHSKNEAMHNFQNEHMQLYGQLKYLLGQKVTTMEFPLDCSISGTKHGGRKSTSGGVSEGVPMSYGDADGAGTSEDHDTTDPVVWIKQSRLHHIFGSSEHCRKYFGNNDIHFMFSIFSYAAPTNAMGVSAHNGLLSSNNLRNSQASFQGTVRGEKPKAGAAINAPSPPRRVNHYQTTFSVSLHELAFTGDCDEVNGATEKIDVFIPVCLRGGQTAAAVVAEAGGPNPFKSTAGFTEPIAQAETDHPLIFKFSVAVAKCAPLVSPSVTATSTATATAAMSGQAATLLSPYSTHMTIINPALVKEEFSMVRSAEHHLSAEIKVKAGSDLGHNMNSSTICVYWPQPSYYDFEILPRSWIAMMTNYGTQHTLGQVFEAAAITPAAHSFAAKSTTKQEAHRLSMHSLDWARKGKVEMLAAKAAGTASGGESPVRGKGKGRKPTRMNNSAALKSTESLSSLRGAETKDFSALASTNDLKSTGPTYKALLASTNDLKSTGPTYKALLEGHTTMMKSIFLDQKPALSVELNQLASFSRRIKSNTDLIPEESDSDPLKKTVNSFIFINELYKYFRQEMRSCLFTVPTGDGLDGDGDGGELAFTSEVTRLKMLLNSHDKQDHHDDIKKEVLDDALTVLDRLISAKNPVQKKVEEDEEELFCTTDDAQAPALIPEMTNWYAFLALFDQFMARNYELGKAENNLLQEDTHIVKIDKEYIRGEDEEAALNDTKYVGMEDTYLSKRLAQEVDVYYREEEKRSKGKVLEEGDLDHYTLANDPDANKDLLVDGGEVMLASNIKVMAGKVEAGVSKIYDAVKAVTTPNMRQLMGRKEESETEAGVDGEAGNAEGARSSLSLLASMRAAVANADALESRSPFKATGQDSLAGLRDASVSDQDTVSSGGDSSHSAAASDTRPRPTRHTSCFASHSVNPTAARKVKTAGAPKRPQPTPGGSMLANIRTVYVEGLQSEERRKRRYNIYASIYSLVNSMSSRKDHAAQTDDASVDVRDLHQFLTGEQEKLRRFMLLANDGRILIPPVTTISSNTGQYYEESAVFLGKFSLARSIVCSWLLSCSPKLRQLFRLYASEGSVMGTRAVIGQVGFMTAAEECFQRLSTQILSCKEGAVREYSKTQYDGGSLLAFMTLLQGEKQAYCDYVAARELEEVQVAFHQGLADRQLSKDEECLMVTMVCSQHGRELFYLHDLCCCQCIQTFAHPDASSRTTPRHFD